VPTHAAFLRAVNLGSTRKASSGQLRSIFEGLGFKDVAPFRTSGNVVFTAPGGSAAKLAAAIERALERELGFEVPVYLRNRKQLGAIAKQCPFPPKALKASKGKLQVSLLTKKPASAAIKRVEALASDQDLLAVKGTELYWLPSDGTQKSALDMKAIDEAIGPMTMRTMGTIEQLAAKLEGGSS
jgi:uncharacterized protein (DUF1697 family)